MKKILFTLLVTLIHLHADAQFHYTKSPFSIGMIVTKEGLSYSIDSLCSGYDSSGIPQDLVIPSGSSMIIFNDTVPSNEGLIYRFSTNGKVKDLGSMMSINSSDGEIDTITIVRKIDNASIQIIWKTDYRKPKLRALIPADDIDLLLQTTFNGLISDRKINHADWENEEYITSIDAYGVPINPLFPTDVNSFIFFPDDIGDEAVWRLAGYEEEFKRADENESVKKLTYRKLPPGRYEFVLKAFVGAGEEYTLRYSFSIMKPWWMTIGGIAGIVFFALSVIGAIVFLLYQRKVKNDKKELEWQKQLAHSELKAIRSQLNPHFMFNALNAIQNLVSMGENTQANQYINKLSKLMRMVLERSESGFHDLNAELENITHYLELENLRMPFQYAINVNKNVSGDMLIPSLLLQPYVENAVIHGIFGKTEGEIIIDIYLKNSMIIFEVKDNGKGLPSGNVHNSGLNLSGSRMDYLNKIYDHHASVKVSNRKDGSGVVVEIAIPTEE